MNKIKFSLMWQISLLYVVILSLSLISISYFSFTSFRSETINQIEDSLGEDALIWKNYCVISHIILNKSLLKTSL